MRDEHIIDLLDRGAVAGLTAEEGARVAAHAATCVACADALDAARVRDALVSARSAASIEPSPFFSTRVMAAVRERAAASDERSLARLWRASRSLLAGMAAAVVVLAGAAYVSAPPAQDVAAGAIYSREWSAIEASDSSAGDLSDDQLVAILYDSEDVYGQGR